MKYSINFMKPRGSEHHRSEVLEHLGFIISNLSYILLFIVLGYSGQKIYQFHSALQKEESLLERLQDYTQRKNPHEISTGYHELKKLQNLESGKVLWSVYLDTIQSLLPAQFRLTRLDFADGTLSLSGIGKVPKAQDPLEPVQKFVKSLNENARFLQIFERLTLNSITINPPLKAFQRFKDVSFTLKAHNR